MSNTIADQNNQIIPRPEHPNPQWERSAWINLNGWWDFEKDDNMDGENRSLREGKGYSGKINVPFCPESALSGIEDKSFMPCIWYHRHFHFKNHHEGRVILHIGASDFETAVWLNGKEAGKHKGGYTPIDIDITDILKHGKNTLVIRCYDNNRSRLQPSGKQSAKKESYGCYYTRTSGIWQTVWLEHVPATYLCWYRAVADPENGSVSFLVRTSGDVSDMQLEIQAYHKNKKMGLLNLPASQLTSGIMTLSEVHKWSPESPSLYDLRFRLKDREKIVDEVKSYIGLRRIELRGNRIFLNGKILFQRLVLDQGYYPGGLYTASSEEDFKRDIKLGQQSGFNGARLHQKVFEPRYLYWADRLGYMVWGEYADWGMDYANPELFSIVMGEWLKILERDFNHPSIITWCVFNEIDSERNDDMILQVSRAVRYIDTTRPVIDSSGWGHILTDVYDIHQYEQDPQKLEASFEGLLTGKQPFRNRPHEDALYRGEPYIVSEYGGILWDQESDNTAWGYGNRPEDTEEFLKRYRLLTQKICENPSIAGYCYTQLYDVEQEKNGLFTYDRRPKFTIKELRLINRIPSAYER